MKVLLILMLALSSGLQAEEYPVNYGKDPQKAAEWEKHLADTPADPLIVKLDILRIGLCKRVDEGQAELEEAIRIWDVEHKRRVGGRLLDDMKRGRKRIIKRRKPDTFPTPFP